MNPAPEAEITSVILRFRDLNTSPGETLALHKERIVKDNAVWWGWWAAANERAVDGPLRILAGLAKGELDVFLYDSGQSPGQLFRARCVDVEWDHKNPEPEPIGSPENGALTPDYYVKRKCKAWFKFTSIEDVQGDLLREYSYVAVPEFFTDAKTPYVKFDRKRIYGLEELFHPRATIWFIRPAQSTDLDYRIEVLGRDVVEPRDFPERVLDLPGTTWLWLSDLHFGGAGEHQFPAQKDANGMPLAEALIKVVDEWADPPATLLVSGDLTWRAEDGQFDQAESCFGQISQRYGLRDTQRMVVPGNHDLRFSEAPEKPSAEVPDVPPGAREGYARFYKDLFYLEPNQYLSSGRRLLLGRSVPVDVALLNSSLLEQVREPTNMRFQGQGYLGDDQLADAAQQLEWQKGDENRAMRVVILHHHVMPVSHSEWVGYGANYDTLLDAGRLTRWIVDYRVDIVLHGHQHAPFFARLARPIPEDKNRWHTFYVVGLGSTGVDHKRLPPDAPVNMFGVINFVTRDRVKVEFHSIDPSAPSVLLDEHELDLAAP